MAPADAEQVELSLDGWRYRGVKEPALSKDDPTEVEVCVLEEAGCVDVFWRGVHAGYVVRSSGNYWMAFMDGSLDALGSDPELGPALALVRARWAAAG